MLVRGDGKRLNNLSYSCNMQLSSWTHIKLGAICPWFHHDDMQEIPYRFIVTFSVEKWPSRYADVSSGIYEK